MPKIWFVILSLTGSSCVFTGESVDLPAIEEVADAESDAGGDTGPAVNERDATVSFDGCSGFARATARLPVPIQQSQAIRESSVFSLFTVGNTQAYGAIWAHTLAGAQTQAYVQMQRFVFNGEFVEFGELQPATFPVEADEQIVYVLQATDST
ncbi:MAG: hypothetical protein R3E66_21555, partial [bacterium]